MTDSALPIGSYSHSWGLETFVQNGTIQNAEDATRAINNLLRFAVAPRDGTAAALAYRFEKSPNRVGNRNSLATINSYLSASMWTEETHSASVDLGRRLLRLAESLGWYDTSEHNAVNPMKPGNGNRNANGTGTGNGGENNGVTESKGANEIEHACHHSVAVGFLGAKLGIDINDLIPAYLFASTTALVAALVKLVPLGHTDGQRIIAQSQAIIAELSPSCICATLGDLGGFAPLSEWASHAHQSLYSRLFQS
jgi:urease accessory protein